MSQVAQYEGAIAIVGMSGRFPGAPTLEAFWNNLREGVESISLLSREELDVWAIDPSEIDDPRYVRARAVLAGIDQFDPGFFDFSPREAEITDPQQRLFLECAWEVLEDAGCDPSRSRVPIGLFAGAGANGYLLWNLASTGHLVGTARSFQALSHNKNDHLTTRVAYKLGLRGPVVTVQTACSTSLVAVTLACQSLLDHQCDMALAGGVALPVPQKVGYLYHERGIGSPDGRCRPFDAQAKGTVAGSGVGIVALKRLEDALEQGDVIRAIIRGAALNNDGASKIGYTAPSVEGQAEVIALAHALSGVDPETISYVEAHGTATPLGDPIEVAALSKAFRKRTQKRAFCALGAVKANIGHLDAAAGVAGLIKTVLALSHQQIPPSAYFESPNPEINFEETPFFVNNRCLDWEARGPRRAGVSSFGLGGTNAHVVLEEAPPAAPSGPSRPWQLLLLSTKSDTALERATARLNEHLRQPTPENLADVAYTLHLGRRAFRHRRMLVCRDVADAIEALGTLQPDRVFTRAEEPVARPLTFMFPGQGAQHVDMGLDLYRGEPIFREAVDQCLSLLPPALRSKLQAALYPEPARAADAADALLQTALAQPALFITSYAMARQWMAWGLAPQSMIGHSVGEYVAACLAGVFSLEDALALITARGRLIQELPGGAMLSVALPEAGVLPLLGDRLSLAAVNGLSLCVVSGPAAEVDSLERQLTEAGTICRRLHTSHAFHSAMMDPILDAFRSEVAQTRRSAPSLRFLSNVTGTWITAEQAVDPDYWVRHLRQTVRFAEGLDELLHEPNAALLEVGPGRTLRTIARWHPHKKPNQVMFASLPHPGERQSDLPFLLNTVGQLWLAGVEVDGDAFYAGQQRRRAALPTYPFDHQRCWIEAISRPGERGHAAGGSLDKDPDITRWFHVPVWKESAPRALTNDTEQSWLLFADQAGIGAEVTERLRVMAGEVIVVSVGARFQRKSERAYEIRPRHREDYDALLADLAAAGRPPRRIAHAWSAQTAVDGASSEILDRGFYSLLLLVQALGAAASQEPLELNVVSRGVQEVTGEEPLCAEQAAVLGICQVATQEMPNLRCRSIDIDVAPAGNARRARLVDQLAAELMSPTVDAVVALRGARRWVEGFEAAPLRPAVGMPHALRERGVYLVTGGLGGLGLTFSEHLAQQVKARLVLVSRAELPPREEWPRWRAAHDSRDPVSRRLAAIERMEEAGAEVLVCQADVTRPEQMRQVVAEALRRFGAIHGVIHAAGVAGGGLIARRTPTIAAEVLAPKIEGTRILESALEGLALDFFVLCSSLSTVVGRFGQVDYTAANAFLDAFARDHQRRTGRFTVAVNWGAWEEVGMAARSSALSAGGVTDGALGHPLLERCIAQKPGSEVYATDFNVDKHWVLDEHRILGNPVIPGVAYFEMVRAALAARATGRSVEFQDVYFVAPLRVRDGATREVQLWIDEDRDGYRFAVRSHAGETATGKLTDYTVGRVRLGEAAPLRRYDIDELRARCNVKELLLPAEEREEDLGPRWHSVQRVYIGHNEVLLALELPEAFAADFDHMKFHPALLDRAAGIAKNFLAHDGHYLPLTYRSLKIKAPLQRRIYSYARFLEHESPDRETITFDIVLMDEQGQALVEIERFTQKRVNDPGAEIRTLAAAAPSATFALPAGHQEILPAEGVDALDRILHARLGPRVIVSVRDLQASMERSGEVVRDRILAAAGEAASAGDQRPRPNLKSPYVAPRNEIESRIAEAWQDVLGIDRVGVEDDFFELGGDSVQAIQIIARGSQLGLKLNPQQFFQYSTIAELAEMLGGILATEAEQGPVVGPVPLVPAQRALLALGSGTGGCVRSAILTLGEPVKNDRITQALADLAARHDALHLRFEHRASGYQQACVAHKAPVPLLDVSVERGETLTVALATVIQDLGSRLRIDEGPLFAAALVRGEAAGDRLVLVGHELVADGPSFQILAQDLATLYAHGGASLGPKTTSFQQWALRLTEAAASDAVQRQAQVWLDAPWSTLSRLPLGPWQGATGPVEACAVSLTADETELLLQRLTDVHRADLREALLAALSLALAGWGGGGMLLVDVVSDGRTALDGLDAPRTVGSFATTYPLLLEVRDPSAAPGKVLRMVKERARKIPQQGIGYGLLRWGGAAEGQALARLPAPEVALNHLGTVKDLSSPFAWPLERIPGERGSLEGRALAVESLITSGRLVVRLSYDASRLPSATAEQLGATLLSSLRWFATEATGATAELSPTDFPFAALDDAQLAALAALVEQEDQDPS